jgi:sec-independent protein translocase protein TatA
MQPGAIFGLGPLELIIIIAIIVVLFLPALLPRITKRLGETFTSLKEMASKFDEETSEEKDPKKTGGGPGDNGSS